MRLDDYITEETRDRILVENPQDKISFDLTGVAPIQAFGEISGRGFYFRARWDAWSFEVDDDNGVLPSDGGNSEEGFVCEDTYKNASYMPLREALKIIEQCIDEYLNGLA